MEQTETRSAYEFPLCEASVWLPEMRMGSSSLTVFMELTNITRCSWCVSSCCRSSIIFAIFVIPGHRQQTSRGKELITFTQVTYFKWNFKVMVLEYFYLRHFRGKCCTSYSNTCIWQLGLFINIQVKTTRSSWEKVIEYESKIMYLQNMNFSGTLMIILDLL